MGKLPKYGYWEWRVGAFIFIFPIALLGMFLFQHIEKIDNPEPTEFSYCYYENNSGDYLPIRLSRFIQGAESARAHYLENPASKEIFGEKAHNQVLPGTRVGIIKYDKSLNFVKIRVYPSEGYSIGNGVGWIPSLFLHDQVDSSKVSQSNKFINGRYFKKSY